MGHKINPEIFRLGTSVDWKYQVRDPLLANITIYKTIKKMFLEYSAPYVSTKIRRKTNPRVSEIQEKNKNVIIKNPFLARSFFFSHLNISYLQKLHLYIFLFDENFEKKRIKKGIYEKKQYYLTGKFFSKDAKHDFYFRKEMFFPLKRNSNQFITKNKKWRTYITIFKNKKLRKWKKVLLRRKLKKKNIIKGKNNFYILKRKKSKKLFLKVKESKSKKLNLVGLWLLNSIIENKNKVLEMNNFKDNLKKFLIFLRVILIYKNKKIKERIFFYAILLKLISKFISALSSKILKNKLILIQMLLNVVISEMQYKYFGNNLHLKLKKSRFLTFNLYSKIITFTLQKTCFIEVKKKTKITYLGMANKHISASLLLNMLIVQLGDYINYRQILQI